MKISLNTTLVKTFLIKGGLVKTGFPISPIVGPLGLNAKKIIDEINLKTKEYYDLRMKVQLVVNLITKDFKINILEPSTSTLIKKFLLITRAEKLITLKRDKFNEFISKYYKDASEKKINCVKGSLRSCKISIEDE